MDTEQQLFGMMAVLEEQQKAVEAAIAGLAAERASMTKVLVAVDGAAQGVRKAAGEAVAASVSQALAGASAEASRALGEATKPVLGQLAGLVRAANAAEGQLNGAVAAFSWKWAAVAGSAAAGGIVAVLLAGWFAGAWQRHQVADLMEQRQQLSAEVARLQTNADAWAARAGRAKLEKCGDPARLCVRVEKKISYGQEADFYVLKGY